MAAIVFAFLGGLVVGIVGAEWIHKEHDESERREIAKTTEQLKQEIARLKAATKEGGT